jgi:hypothetical protein
MDSLVDGRNLHAAGAVILVHLFQFIHVPGFTGIDCCEKDEAFGVAVHVFGNVFVGNQPAGGFSFEAENNHVVGFSGGLEMIFRSKVPGFGTDGASAHIIRNLRPAVPRDIKDMSMNVDDYAHFPSLPPTAPRVLLPARTQWSRTAAVVRSIHSAFFGNFA